MMIDDFMIDTHLHIDFYDNQFKVIKDIFKNNMTAIFVTHLPELYIKHKKMIENTPNIFLAVGFHPILVNEYDFHQDLFLQSLSTTKFIGEVGLDFNIARSQKSRKKQIEIFDKICSLSDNHILSIHSRNAEKEVLDILMKNNTKKAIFHWYTGSESLIESIVEAGYYFSLNPSMLKTQKGKKILKKIPLDRILIETDGPFVKYEGSIISPDNFKNVYNSFKKFYEVNNFQEIVKYNFLKLLNSDI